MRTHLLHSFLFASLLLIGAAVPAAAQTDTQDHDAHHPAETEGTPPSTGEAPAAGMPGGMPAMMTPEMMQMMQGKMSESGMPVMMGQGQPPMAGGMMMCPMMQRMMGQGAMGGMGVLYGMPDGAHEEITPERVRAFLEQRLAWHDNPRLKSGEIATATEETITAEIVTVDGSLVQKLAFNRYPGLFRQITE
jgi:hypothetical protein